MACTDKNGLLLVTQDTRIADDVPPKGSTSLDQLGKGPPTIKPKPIRPFQPRLRKFSRSIKIRPKQTRDLRPLRGYGMGSGTLARWIQENLDRDKKPHKRSD